MRARTCRAATGFGCGRPCPESRAARAARRISSTRAAISGYSGATSSTLPAEYAANSGAYIGCSVAGAAFQVPAVAARTRYLNVYSPWGSRSKKKFVPLSRISSYHPMPRSHL